MKGRTIYTRAYRLAGYDFIVPNLTCPSPFADRRNGGTPRLAAHDVDVYLAFLNRLVVSCGKATREVQSLMGEVSLQEGAFVMIQVASSVLADIRFRNSLVRAANVIRGEGFRLKVSIDSGELGDVRDLRLFRQALYELGDEGIGAVLKNLQSGCDSSFAESIVYRAVPQLSVSPQWLGIGSSDCGFDHSLYLERITLLNAAIHGDGKSVICEGVANDWQRSFVSALPVSLFGFLDSKEDVIV
ncbi:MAG: hypothetical protein HUJ14_11485 [Marinobacter sp.]|nr:hypothetical protein [Marinobacter sp.]